MREIDARMQNPIQMAPPIKNNFWADEFAKNPSQQPTLIQKQDESSQVCPNIYLLAFWISLFYFLALGKIVESQF
jgi:hypothetical protein